MATKDVETVSTRTGAGLAWLAAAIYVLMVMGIPYPELGAQRGLFAVAAASYAVGGLLLWRGVGTRLLAAGIVANVAVMGFWLVRAATGASPVDAFALLAKAVEIALEIALLVSLLGRLRRHSDVPRPVAT